MNKMQFAALTAGLLSIGISSAALADDDYLSLNGGYYDALRKDQKAGQFGAEYRFQDLGYGVHPMAGAFFTTEGSLYGYGGLNWNVPLIANELYLVPNFAVGAYSQGGGKDLGGVLEFRSGIELDYQLPNTQQIGLTLNHISNASIYSHNPGEETIMVNYNVPIGAIRSLFSR